MDVAAGAMIGITVIPSQYCYQYTSQSRPVCPGYKGLKYALVQQEAFIISAKVQLAESFTAMLSPQTFCWTKNHVAKVADFGLSRLRPRDENHVSTAVKGTFGYLDPECFGSQQLTEKSDVYSFGGVLFGILSARQAINASLPREQVNLADWAMLCKSKGLLEEIVDPWLKVQISPKSMRKFAEVAAKCLQDDGRPTMGGVLWDLEHALQLQISTTDASSALPFPNIRRFPSYSTSIGKVDMSILSDQDYIQSDHQKVKSSLNWELKMPGKVTEFRFL